MDLFAIGGSTRGPLDQTTPSRARASCTEPAALPDVRAHLHRWKHLPSMLHAIWQVHMCAHIHACICCPEMQAQLCRCACVCQVCHLRKCELTKGESNL